MTAACLACGNFIVCFPEESRPALPSLYPMFFHNLEDPIPSVRQGAASSIANVVRAYGQEALATVMEKITIGLKGVRNQPAESERYRDMEHGQASFGVVKRLRDNDLELHSDKQVLRQSTFFLRIFYLSVCLPHFKDVYFSVDFP